MGYRESEVWAGGAAIFNKMFGMNLPEEETKEWQWDALEFGGREADGRNGQCPSLRWDCDCTFPKHQRQCKWRGEKVGGSRGWGGKKLSDCKSLWRLKGNQSYLSKGFLKSDWESFYLENGRLHVQFSSVAQLCPTLCEPTDCVHQASLFITNSQACSDSCPSSQWCHPAILSSVVPFSSCLQSFPASGSFPMSQFFRSGGQSTGVSASASVLPMNIQDWFPLGWTGCYLLAVQGTLKSLLQHHSSKASIVQPSAFFIVQLSHPYTTTGKTIALTRQTLLVKYCLCFLIFCLGLL